MALGWDELFEDFPKLSVSEYTAAVKRLLEGGIGPSWVTGEVSNLRRQSSGHIYFTLKDRGAQLPAVMFRGQASRLGFEPREGMEVVALGEISVYEPHGRYQLIVREMQESGQGRLFREFERLKRKLGDEGLFDRERKRAFPVLPLRVAVVTSPTGAALQDFLRILKRRDWGGSIQIYPTKVQGGDAGEGIVRSIQQANAVGGYDLIVVTRGGGSIEDLWCFNEEQVARAVAASEVPVVSAVGHEIDFTLSDFASDLRAETPSAAAEMISSAYIDCLDRLDRARDGLDDALVEGMDSCKQDLDTMYLRMRSVAPESALERAFMGTDELRMRLASVFREETRRARDRVSVLERRLLSTEVSGKLDVSKGALRECGHRFERSAAEGVRRLREQLNVMSATMKAMSPRATLERGFAILETEDGRAVTGVSDMKKGDSGRVTLKDGRIGMTVESVEPDLGGDA